MSQTKLLIELYRIETMNYDPAKLIAGLLLIELYRIETLKTPMR